MLPQYTVRTLRLGTIHTERSAAVLGAPPGAVDLPIWCAAIEGNGRRILVDTGMKNADKWSKFAPHELAKDETIDARLADLGWSAKDIDIVVNSHLHYDHAENNLAFPQAQVFVSGTEWNFAADPSSAQAPLYDLEWTGPELSYMNYTLVGIDHCDVMPGLRIIQTPGHTPGHQSVLVNTAEGTLCVTGDAACMLENLSIPAPPGTHISGKVSLESIDKICRLSDRILMNHDPELKQFQDYGFPVTPRTVRV